MSLDARFQLRVQRYGWDLAADAYDALWSRQLEVAQAQLLETAALRPGERVLDVACGTGLITLPAARCVGSGGLVLGTDLSQRMVEAARRRAAEQGLANVRCERMDAQQLPLADGGFDAALCALGLMYAPSPEQVLREMRRVLRPGGRMAVAVWGDRRDCGWSAVFGIVADEVASEVCPLFFRLGQPGELQRACEAAGVRDYSEHRLREVMYYADAQEACDAAFIGGPVALAWTRMSTAARTRACERYLESIEPFRSGQRYAIPVEFVIARAVRND